MGVMDGKVIGDSTYFMPDEAVSRAQFLTMAMKCMGISGDKSTSKSYFDDNDEISAPYLPYAKAASKLGIVTGEFKNGKLLFRPNDTITKYEAAMIISKLIDISEASTSISFSDTETVPVWARDEVSALCSMGIISCDGEIVNGKAELTKANAAEYLYNMLSHK